jgi:hypothetical protein
MRVVAYLLLFGLLFSLESGAENNSVSASATDAPRLVVGKRIHDFGTVNEGAVVNYSFSIKNEGKSPLVLRDVRSDCGCTTVLPEVQELSPNSEAEIRTSFNTSGFRGKKVKTVRLFTNDPSNASVLLELRGRIRAQLNVDPPRVYIREMIQGETASKVVKVSPLKGVKVERVYSRSGFIQVQEVPETPNTWEVSLSGDLPVGTFRDQVIIQSNSKISPIVNVPVFAVVVGDLHFDPIDVSFGLVEGPLKESLSKRVRLIQRSGSGVRIEKVQSSDPRVGARITESGASGEPEIEISLESGAVGTIRATVTALTSHSDPSQKELAIKVYGILAEKGA